MKRQLSYIYSVAIILVFLLFAGCQRRERRSESTSAAIDVYQKYVNRKDLTVALIGDFKGYNAVLLQACDNIGWLQLCEEFGVDKKIDADVLDSNRVSSLKVTNISVNGVNELDELMYGIADSCISKMVSHIVAGHVPLNDVRGLNPVSVQLDTAYAIQRTMHYKNGVLVDSSRCTDTEVSGCDERLVQTCISHDNKGYIVHDDSRTLSLWLFFYTTDSEKEQILNNIILTR